MIAATPQRPPRAPAARRTIQAARRAKKKQPAETPPQDIARARLGLEDLRPGQAEAVRALLEGHDTLVVQPPGAGKPAIYQMAASRLPGPTVVVSPHRALQRELLAALEGRGVGSVPEAKQQEVLKNLEEGDLGFLFLSPEQFNDPAVIQKLRQAKPSLLAVDEAQCISRWGHDFRPEYARLGTVVEALGHPRVIALTAIASPPVREEIVQRLGMRSPCVIVSGVDRPNISLRVERFHDAARKEQALLDSIAAATKPGIVYTGTRKHAEDLARELTKRGFSARAYHAGLRAAERDEAQQAFMEGNVDVIAATNAFGTGIETPDVRFVFHADVPTSLDAYYQEIGRAGRDGEPARAVLFYNPQDLRLSRFLASSGRLGALELERLAETLEAEGEPIHPNVLRCRMGFAQSKLLQALNRLEDVNAVETLANGKVRWRTPDGSIEEIAAAAARMQDQRREFELSLVGMMRAYAEQKGCRRTFLLNYFGERAGSACGHCDNCEEGSTARLERAEHTRPFELQSRIVHRDWGTGIVQHYEGNKMLVLFEKAGYKTFRVDNPGERALFSMWKGD